MHKSFFSFFLFLSIFLAVAFFVLQTPFILNWLIPPLAARHMPFALLENLHIQRQSYRFPNRLVLGDTRFTLGFSGQRCDVRLEKVAFNQVIDFLRTKRQLVIEAQGVTVNGFGLDVRQMRFKGRVLFEEDPPWRAEGVAQIGQARFLGYALDNFSAHFKGDPRQLQIYEIQALGYAGECSGQISLNFQPHFTYLFWIEFSGLQPGLLKEIHPRFFGQFDGPLQGTWRLTGNRTRIDVLSLHFTMPQGGALRPGIMRRIMPLIKDAEQRAVVDWIVQAEGRFPVDKATVQIQNSYGNKIVLFADLTNIKHQIVLKKSLEIFLDKSIADIVFSGESFINPQ